MDAFVGKIKDSIMHSGLLRRGDRVVVAVSGGADSVALLSVLSSMGYDCIAAHCNFHLRGEESMRDMRFVESLCARLGIELRIKDFDVEAQRKATGESLEMACRTLRYRWFNELLERSQAAAIAVGHHREDRVETFFLNLLRGTGLSGLTSMRPKSGNVIRPLLDVSRKEIEEYLSGLGLDWVDDSTNSSDEFQRNRLRNRLLPMMEELFPGATDSVLRTMSNLDENKHFYDMAVEQAAKDFVNPLSGEINLLDLMQKSADAQLLLFETLRGEGFSRRQTDDMLRAAERSGGSFIAGKNHCRQVDHGILRAPRAAVCSDDNSIEVSMERDIEEPIKIEISFHDISEFAPERDANVIYLDASAVDAGVWHLRHWHRGDRMIPFGMKGSKLLSDIFAGARLSDSEKRSTWLLTCCDRIVWAVGLRASALFEVTKNTKRYVRLQFRK